MQTAYDKCPKRALCNRTHTHLQPGAASPFTFWPLPLSPLCNQRDGTFMPPELPFSYSQQITSIPLMSQIWEFTFSHCHAAEVKHQCSPEEIGASGPVKQEARCCLKILVSVQCVISRQIIEISIGNHAINSRTETSCWISAYRRLQSGWHTPCGSVSFLRAPRRVLHMIGTLFFSRKKFGFLLWPKMKTFYLPTFPENLFFFSLWSEFRIISVRPVEALQRQVLGKRKQKLQSVFF